MIVMGKPLTTTFVSANVHVPTEQVGCLQVTNRLRDFLSHFPPESKEKAFEQIYEILQVLNAYLILNPQQHIHCMSPDNEYVSLIMYATTIEIDLCNFPAIWAVLSILLDTQSNTLPHVKSFQQVVNNYYDKRPADVMSELEQKASSIMKAMYDSIDNAHFDGVSGDLDRVSDAVDSDYDVNDYDKDENVMPYDKDENAMPYDKDENVMPYDRDEYVMPYEKEKYETYDVGAYTSIWQRKRSGPQGRATWAPTLWCTNMIPAEQNSMKNQENSTHATEVCEHAIIFFTITRYVHS